MKDKDSIALTEQQLQLMKASIELKRKLEEVARLWVRWNRKAMSGDEVAAKLRGLLIEETNTAWRNFLDPLKANDPLRALVI